MGRQRGQTRAVEKELKIHNYKMGKSYRQIGKIVNRSHTTVQSILDRYKNENGINNKVRKSPKFFFNDYDERWILRKVEQDPKISVPKLAKEVEKHLHKNVNPQMIKNVLQKHKLNNRVARKKSFISKVNKVKRLNFAKEYLEKDFEFWKEVIFTDKVNLTFGDQMDSKEYGEGQMTH